MFAHHEAAQQLRLGSGGVGGGGQVASLKKFKYLQNLTNVVVFPVFIQLERWKGGYRWGVIRSEIF